MAFNILIVDDSIVSRGIVSKSVELSNIPAGELYEATNGAEAISLLKDHWIDIVFADINMPVMNGVELVAEMASRDLMSTIPVVIISTEKSVTRMQELMSKGVRAYLNKPVTPENIIRNTMYCISSGMGVCMLSTLMATDHGVLRKGEHIIACAGSFLGLDTSCVIRASNSVDLFEDEGLIVEEIICKPRDPKYEWPIQFKKWKGNLEQYRQFHESH